MQDQAVCWELNISSQVRATLLPPLSRMPVLWLVVLGIMELLRERKTKHRLSIPLILIKLTVDGQTLQSCEPAETEDTAECAQGCQPTFCFLEGQT